MATTPPFKHAIRSASTRCGTPPAAARASAVNVNVVIADKKDVLTIPYNAIAREKGKTFAVMAKADGTAGDKVPVELGITDGSAYEVVSGVNEGDTVTAQRADADSEWNNDSRGGGGMNSTRGRMMMMRTMGGGSGGGRGR